MFRGEGFTKSEKYDDPEYYIWHRIRGKANQFKLDFDILPEDIHIPEVCPVLGIPLRFSKSRTANTPSIDRIDNTKGYIKGNVAIISDKANRMKQNNSLETLRSIIKYIEENT